MFTRLHTEPSTVSAGIDSDSANASTNSVAVAKRSPGDLANPDRNTAFTRSGASQVPGGTAGMGSVTCWVATAIGVGARYGGLPVRHSNTTQAKAYWSVAPSTSAPVMSSCSAIFPSATGAKKLGQPEPESYLVAESKSASPQPAQR